MSCGTGAPRVDLHFNSTQDLAAAPQVEPTDCCTGLSLPARDIDNLTRSGT